MITILNFDRQNHMLMLTWCRGYKLRITELILGKICYTVTRLAFFLLQLEILGWKQKKSYLKNVVRCMHTGRCPIKVSDDMWPYYNKRDEFVLENGIILWGLRVVIPRSFEKTIWHELHHQHPGIVRMKGLAQIHAWFPGIDRCIENVVQSCSDGAKVANSPPKNNPHPWDWPIRPMDRLHLDFFDPFYGRYCLVMVDSHSGWMEAKQLICTNSNNTINILGNMVLSIWFVETNCYRQRPTVDFERICWFYSSEWDKSYYIAVLINPYCPTAQLRVR